MYSEVELYDWNSGYKLNIRISSIQENLLIFSSLYELKLSNTLLHYIVFKLYQSHVHVRLQYRDLGQLEIIGWMSQSEPYIWVMCPSCHNIQITQLCCQLKSVKVKCMSLRSMLTLEAEYWLEIQFVMAVCQKSMSVQRMYTKKRGDNLWIYNVM